MEDDETCQQLREELLAARQRIAELEAGVTERNAVECAQREGEQRFRAQYKGLPIPVYTWQRDGKDFVLTDYNDAAEKITHGNVVRLLGAKASDLYRDDPDIVAEMWQCYTGQRSFRREMLYRYRSTEEEKHLSVSYGFVPPDVVLVHTEDVTERRRAETALQRERDFIATILATAGALVVVLDLQGRIVRFNHACEQTTGYSFDEVVGQPFWDLFLLPDEVESVKTVFRQLATGRFPNEYENYWAAKDGSRRLIAWSNTALAGEAGPVEYVVGTGIDITQRRQTEDALHKAYADLEQRVQARTADLVRLNQALAESEERLEERVAARTRELSALYDVTAVASASLDLETVLEQSLSRVLDVMGCESGGIHLWDDRHDALQLAVWQGPLPTLVPEMNSAAYGSLPVDSVVSRDEPLVIMSAGQRTPAPLALQMPHAYAYAGAPVHAKGQVLGVLSVLGGPSRQFSAEEVALLASIADQVGVAVENARLYQQAERLAVLEERERLARELHDSVTQSLYSSNLIVETARRAAGSGDVQRVETYLKRLGEITQAALKEMRLLVYELRPPALEQETLAGALQKRLDAVEGRAGVQARLLVEGECHLPAAVEEALYRIAEEALNNALRHAVATAVTVSIVATERLICLEVTDNGSGFDPARMQTAGGMGLVSMRQRAERVGGAFSIHATPGGGTRVQVCVELGAQEGL